MSDQSAQPPVVGPRPSREDLGRRVADVCVQWSREDDEREGASATWEALNSHRRELYMRVGEALFGLGMTWSPVPPLPDSETEQQRWFVIAGPGTPTELGGSPLEADWDGVVYPGLTADLAASLAACRQTYDDWGVYELVRVPDPEVTS